MMPTTGFRTRLTSGSMREDFTAGVRFFCEGLMRAVSAGQCWIANRSSKAAYAVFFLILLSAIQCLSADLVLIRSPGSSSPEQHELELAAEFYGLNLTVVTARTNNTALILNTIHDSAIVGVAIEVDALSDVNQRALLAALRRGRTGSLPLLILGMTPDTDQALLRKMSGGAAIGVGLLTSPSHLHYSVGHDLVLTQQLTNLEIPFPGDNAFYFYLGPKNKGQVIMAVGDDRQKLPVFIEEDLQEQEVFLLCRTSHDGDIAVQRTSDSVEDAFEKVAAEMIYVKHIAGKRGWHALHHYANLTIDDPWLREPYGNLSYEGLLKEMEKHDFHTTIAFIPWNYDRSEAETALLFRRHPDRFSICIHGDDHAHKEFTDYADVPLDVQVAALQQSLARMERFQALTGIPYDRVMVFPHSIAPEGTLAALKASNYLATINSENVPMDSVRPQGALFALRPSTLLFGGFPSIFRDSVDTPIPTYRIAINDFLDNPSFYYTHEGFFGSGIDAFDGTADEVNKLEPDTRWRSVGDIVNHLYLVKLRDDSNYDVLALADSLQLENTTDRDLLFFVRKQETGPPAIASASVDGKETRFELRKGSLELCVPVAAGQSRRIVIQYVSDVDLASISTKHSSFRAYFLRNISDFRDITLSSFRVGRSFIVFYNNHRLRAGLLIMYGGGLILFCAIGGWKLLMNARRRNGIQATRTIS